LKNHHVESQKLTKKSLISKKIKHFSNKVLVFKQFKEKVVYLKKRWIFYRLKENFKGNKAKRIFVMRIKLKIFSYFKSVIKMARLKRKTILI
jgi:hypothetical protein